MSDGENIAEHLAGVEDFIVALATYWPPASGAECAVELRVQLEAMRQNYR